LPDPSRCVGLRGGDPLFGGITALMTRDTVAPLSPSLDADLVEARRGTAILAHKDLRTALALARDLGVDLPLTAMAEARYDEVLGLPPG